MFKRPSGRLAAALVAATVAGLMVLRPAAAETAALKIGLAASANNKAIEAVLDRARAQGLDVKLVEFTDWNAPNVALAEGAVDVNFYQHIPFLEAAKKGNGYDFVPVGIGFISVSGIYSKRIKDLAELKDGATVTISNDPTNLGRALLLLRDAKLIKLRDGADYRATLSDIVGNPKRLKVVPLEAQQVVRSIDDADIAVTFPSFLRLVGVDPNGALLYEKPQKIWAIRFVTRPQQQADERIQRFIQIYQDAPETKAVLKGLYGDLVSFGWEQ
ncbi:MetQ/NlpA family ABC transporter substrate-binding protein [Chelatococcus reniformis]|uniref:Lipoprotein n=1 Tax=Chelatococcus reniformis TaxID=1494448 RepID=A0A916ULU7_9HYPH|nr:MetQ/NlpA family ABC transporter substrate-binding protein [Chelatococcus reniformis]GGC77631.1 lipoprotein [Chelatococcus reniformis]